MVYERKIDEMGSIKLKILFYKDGRMIMCNNLNIFSFFNSHEENCIN